MFNVEFTIIEIGIKVENIHWKVIIGSIILLVVNKCIRNKQILIYIYEDYLDDVENYIIYICRGTNLIWRSNSIKEIYDKKVMIFHRNNKKLYGINLFMKNWNFR